MNQRTDTHPQMLIVRARRGDTQALGLVLDSFRNYLKLMARLQIHRGLQGKLDPSDLVQDTYLETQRYIGTFRGATEQEFLVWLRQILARTVTERIRRYYGTRQRDVRLERSIDEQLDQSSQRLDRGLVDKGRSPSSAAQQREWSVMLANALEQLPAHYREALVLRNLEQLPFPEVARRMARSVASVEKIWIRAIAALRSALGAEL